MKEKIKVWALLGVSEEARRLAKKEAKAEGLHIGEWVEEAINGWDKKKQTFVYDGEKFIPSDSNNRILENTILCCNQINKLAGILYEIKDSLRKPWWKFW